MDVCHIGGLAKTDRISHYMREVLHWLQFPIASPSVLPPWFDDAFWAWGLFIFERSASLFRLTGTVAAKN